MNNAPDRAGLARPLALDDILAPLAVVDVFPEPSAAEIEPIAPLISSAANGDADAAGVAALTPLANINGTIAADELNGTPEADTIRGGRGEDTIFGAAGDDDLRGNGDEDTIRGGPGADFINGGKGDDKLFGGGGDDRISDRGGGDDTISGGAGDDVVFARGGADIINGDGGDDTLFGGGGRDQIFGGDGSDSLIGQKSNDTLDGGAGDDFLSGNEGSDTLRGGDGADSFRYTERTGGVDEIVDFDQSEGDRVFILAEVFEATPVSADADSFVRVEDRGDDAVVQIDPDGSGPAASFVDIAVLNGNAGIEADIFVGSTGNVLIS